MVHRKLKPDQEDAELDGEEGEKKGKKVIFHQMHYLVICLERYFSFSIMYNLTPCLKVPPFEGRREERLQDLRHGRVGGK